MSGIIRVTIAAALITGAFLLTLAEWAGGASILPGGQSQVIVTTPPPFETDTNTPVRPSATNTYTSEPTLPPRPTRTPIPIPTQCVRPYGWLPYTIRAGDTLFSISRAVGVSALELQRANCLSNPNLIHGGDILWVPRLPPTPTRKPSTTPTPTLTETPTLVPPEAFTLSQECQVYSAQAVGQALGLSDVNFLIDQAPDSLNRVDPQAACGQDGECARSLLLHTLFRDLTEAGFEASPGERPPAQVLGTIGRILDDPAGETACGDLGAAAWELALRFSIHAVSVDGFALHSPANLQVTDKQGHVSGFGADGSRKQEIADSVVTEKAGVQYIFVPGRSEASVDAQGISEGEMTIDAIRSTADKVQDMSFEKVPVNGSTHASLNLSGQVPYLQVQEGSTGQLASVDPTRFQEYPIIASAIPPTETSTLVPTETYTPTQTSTPGLIGQLTTPPLLSSVFLICGASIVLVVEMLGLIYAFYTRKPKQKQPGE